MADLSTVERAILAQIAAVVFPGVAYSAGAQQASVPAGLTLRLYRGWPLADDLDADMLAGRAQVCVHAEQGMSRNTTRYFDRWHDGAAVTPTLTAVADGATVTFGGTGAAGQVVGVTVGDGTVPTAYVLRLGATQTSAQVAGAFAAGVIEGASAVGAVLTVPGTAGARVVADSPALRLLRQQEQGIRVAIWCPTPATRDSLAGLIDAGLAEVHRFDLSDGSACRLTWRGTYSFEPAQKSRIWRRDLAFIAEFATTVVEDHPAMLFGTLGAGLSQGATGVPEVGDIGMLAGPASPRLTIYTDEDGNPLMDAGGNLLGPVPE